MPLSLATTLQQHLEFGKAAREAAFAPADASCKGGAGTVREVSCPSDGEEQAALYNMACSYAQLGQREAALTCLEAVLEAGFTDIGALRQDPDLEGLRGRPFDELLGR